MNVLLTNRSLKYRAGSETWVLTMYEELTKRGYEVDVFTASENKMIKASYDPKKHYEFALVNHNICLAKVKDWDIGRIIFTSHGIIPKVEHPIKGADKYVGVSEEVAEDNERRGFPSVVIRNPVNTCIFKPTSINKTLKNILYLDNRLIIKDIVEEACRGYDLRIVAGGEGGINTKIAWADLVITLGRGCYESLSSGKNVIIFGRCGADGLLTEEKYLESRKNNCSGRRFGMKWTAGELRDELLKYDPNINLRPLIVQCHGVKRIVENYIKLANS